MDIPWNLIRNGATPPPPSSSEGCGTLDNVGTNLLALVRSLEKSNSADYNTKINDVAEILRNLLAVYSRRGLLQGDVTKAEKIVNTNGQGPTMVGGGRRDKKTRKSGKRGSGNELRFYDGDGDTAGESNNVVRDEALVLSALVRILGGSSGNETQSPSTDLKCDLSLIGLAAQIVTSLGERIKTLLSCDVCASAENELISSSGRTLLVGLTRTMHTILSTMLSDFTDDKGITLYVGFYGKKGQTISTAIGAETEYDGQGFQILAECLRASSSLLVLFGTRLSRSSSILPELSAAAWFSLSIPNDEVQLAAATLLACSPLTGIVQKSTPADTWTSCIVESAAALFVLLDALKGAKKSSWKKEHEKNISNDTLAVLNDWSDFIRQNLQNAQQQAKAFCTLMHGLTMYLLALLGREGYDSRAQSVLVTARMPIEYLLDLSELMISSPTAAESMYYNTKKRLRMEPIKGSFLSPKTVAFDVANTVKSLGHSVLNATLGSMGGSGALAYGRRIMRIVYSSLLVSCSGPLRKVLDLTGATRLDGKRKRWLHNSIPIRAQAVKSFRMSIEACGSNVVVSRSTGARLHDLDNGNPSSRSITIVAGYLLEQITWKASDEVCVDEDWGSFEERVELASLAAESLATCLIVCGGYMQTQSRSLIDSVASTCLSTMAGKESSQILSWARARVSVLTLGAKCISTPWPDGAMSSLTGILRHTATMCKYDRDPNASAAAHAALCLCDALAMPRAPPLSVITRRETVGGDADQANSQFHLLKSLHAVKEKLGEKENSDSKASEEMGSTPDKKRARIEAPTALEKVDRVEVNEDKSKEGESSRINNTSPKPAIQQKMELTSPIHVAPKAEENPPEGNNAAELAAEDGDVGTTVEIEGIPGAEASAEPLSVSVLEELPSKTGPLINTKVPQQQENVHQQNKTDENRENFGSESGSDSDLPAIFDCGPDDDDM